MKILVVGAGIAGMAAALALDGPGREIVIVERDPPPPDVPMDEVFNTWQRKGVAQLRHAHGYTARLFNVIRDRHPDLLQALFAAGADTMTFVDMLSESLHQTYRPKAGDEDLTLLFSRRTTLEFVVRGYAEKRCGIAFVTDATLRGVVAEKDSDGILAVKGVTIQRPDVTQEEIRADVVIDASGRLSRFPDFLAEYGITPVVEEAPIGIVYFTRFYRFKSGEKLKWDLDNPGIKFGFLRGGMLPADGSSFAVMFWVPLGETVLRQRLPHPHVFDRICAAFPNMAAWTSRAVPVNKPMGMGDLKNRWVHWIKDGEPLVKNLFAVGDAAVRTNPAFGRGCSFAFVASDILAEVLRATNDPIARARLFESRMEAALRPSYQQFVRQDRAMIEESSHVNEPGYRPNWRTRVMNSFAEDAIGPAVRDDMVVRRAFFRAAHMLEPPTAWLRKPSVLARVLLKWMTPRRAKSYEPPPAIDYNELIALAQAD